MLAKNETGFIQDIAISSRLLFLSFTSSAYCSPGFISPGKLMPTPALYVSDVGYVMLSLFLSWNLRYKTEMEAALRLRSLPSYAPTSPRTLYRLRSCNALSTPSVSGSKISVVLTPRTRPGHLQTIALRDTNSPGDRNPSFHSVLTWSPDSLILNCCAVLNRFDGF
jgi:hypothetical protein